MTALTRRKLLTRIGAATIASPAVTFGYRASAALPPLPNLPARDGLLLRPGDAQFARVQKAFNARTMLIPQLRALCKNGRAAGVMVDWCRSNKLAFAVRCGGHSYEGFSQSASVVIDTRMINSVAIDRANKTATVGAGASLGELYLAIASHGFTFPGGSCPTVGVSGHVLGGGYGYLARPFGLACDNLLSIDLIDAQGEPIRADAEQNADLFWASRGGGGGCFGVVTGYRLRLIALASVLTFNVKLSGLSVQRAAAIMNEWQAWAPRAPKSIDSNLVIAKDPHGGIVLRCAGQSIGASKELQRELRFLPSAPLTRRKYLDSITYFAGGQKGWNYPSYEMKGKSDYAASPLTDVGLSTLMNEVANGAGMYVICDSYGGAIADTAPDATAFAHRTGTLYCLQYGSTWTDPRETPTRLSEMRSAYSAMRPYVSGAAYINYCDLDLADWQNAYWGQNLARLKQIKSKFDPDNIFRHAQSIPPA